MNNILDCLPLKARNVFRWRPLKNVAFAAAVFAAIFSLAFFSINPWILGIVALVAAGFVFFYLESFFIVIECPNCQKDIDTRTPWECGFKQCRNENADEFPFIRKCQHCGLIPKAYVCHHCGKPIYLTPDRQSLHAAKCLVAPEPVKVKTVVVVKDVVGDKVATQREEVRDKEHQLKLTTLDKQIEIVKNTPVVSENKTAEQILEDEIVQELKQGRNLYGLKKRLEARADIELANDEHGREQQYALIENAIRKRMD
jgi:hypothetical protein